MFSHSQNIHLNSVRQSIGSKISILYNDSVPIGHFLKLCCSLTFSEEKNVFSFHLIIFLNECKDKKIKQI